MRSQERCQLALLAIERLDEAAGADEEPESAPFARSGISTTERRRRPVSSGTCATAGSRSSNTVVASSAREGPAGLGAAAVRGRVGALHPADSRARRARRGAGAGSTRPEAPGRAFALRRPRSRRGSRRELMWTNSRASDDRSTVRVAVSSTGCVIARPRLGSGLAAGGDRAVVSMSIRPIMPAGARVGPQAPTPDRESQDEIRVGLVSRTSCTSEVERPVR